MFLRNIILGALVAVAAGSCGPTATKRACVGGTSGDSTLVTDAAVVRLDVYDATTASCQDGMLAPGAPLPTLTRTYVRGTAISLDVPPGDHVLVLTTYSDDAATMVLGVGCTEAKLAAGSQICFDLTLVPGPDAGVDLAACAPGNPACQCTNDADCMDPSLPRCSSTGRCVACLPQNDNCSFDHYCDATTNTCNSGCKSSAECAQLAGADGGVGSNTLCDLTRHVCVECLTGNDCPANKVCSMAGTCVVGCDPTQGKLCPGGLACCNKQCVDTTSDPFNCNGCGNVCANGNNTCCAGICKNTQIDADNCGGCGKVCSANHMATRTCGGGVCNGTCAANFGDCNGNKQTDGCEVDLTSTTSSCGACGTNCLTQVKNATGTFCNNKVCDYGSCASATFGDCNGVRSDGCEVDLTSTTNHCGSCLIDCGVQEQNATGVFCSGSSCNYTSCSAPNFKDCNNARTDGCEVNTNTATGNCGACGTDCTTKIKNANGPFCNTGSCDYVSCAATNFKDCNMVRADGCEIDVNGDTSNCGACGRACSSANTATVHCSAGLCDSTCQPNFGNCSEPTGGTADDGCESNLTVCTGQACCSTTVPTPANMCAPSAAHVNGPVSYGLGQNYTDCHALGTPGDQTTYTQQMALEAQAAAPGTNKPAATCGNSNCLNKIVGGLCVVWCYQNDTSGSTVNPIAGHVFQNSSSTCKFCPIPADPTWN